MDKNIVVLEGTVANDPTVRDTKNSRVMNFRIATHEEGRQYPDYNNVVVWDKQIIRVAEGDRVGVRGRLQTRSYEAQGGKRYITEVVAQEFYRLDSAAAEENYFPPDEDDDLPF